MGSLWDPGGIRNWIDLLNGTLCVLGPFMAQEGAQRVPMGALWDHICEISGKVKVVLSPAREHQFQVPRGPEEHRMGNFSCKLFGDVFRRHLFAHFAEFNALTRPG